jgi:hypothetical protein
MCESSTATPARPDWTFEHRFPYRSREPYCSLGQSEQEKHTPEPMIGFRPGFERMGDRSQVSMAQAFGMGRDGVARIRKGVR